MHACFSLLSLALALWPTTGHAAPAQRYLEYVYYDFFYRFAPATRSVIGHFDGNAEYRYDVHQWDDPGGYDGWTAGDEYPPIRFGFYIEAPEIVSLSGLVLDLRALPTTIGGYAPNFYGSFFDHGLHDCDMPSAVGQIAFSSAGSIASYDLWMDECANYRTTIRSAATDLESVFAHVLLAGVKHPEVLIGASGYDMFYAAPDEHYITPRPGLWGMRIERFCLVETVREWGSETDDVPCPPLYAGPVSSVPLPAAGWLLLAALGTLGLAGRRRRQA